MKQQAETGRPLFLFSAVLFISSVAIAGFDGKTKLLLLLVCLLLLSAYIIAFKLKKRRLQGKNVFIIVFCALIVSIIPSYIVSFQREAAAEYDGTQTNLTATVIKSEYSSSYYGYVTVRASLPNGKIRKIFLGLPDGSLVRGDTIECTAVLHATEDDDSSRLSDGVLLTGECEAAVRTGKEEKFSVVSLLARINEKLCAEFYANADKDAAALSSAVLCGDRSMLSPSARRDFARLGISHLLAISGLHLSVLTVMLEAVLIKSGAKRKVRGTALILSILLFMGITGFSPSVTRAGIMHIIRITGSLIGRKSDPLTSLGTAAAIIVLADPYAAFDIRLLLSVSSAFACIIFTSYTSHALCRKKQKNIFRRAAYAAANTAKLTILITVFTLPTMWKTFGSFSLLSPLSNIIFIPLMTVYMYFSVLLLILLPFPILSHPASYAAGTIARFIFWLSSSLSSLRGITVSLNYKFAGAFVWLLFVCSFITAFLNRKRIGYLFSGLAAVMLIACIVVGIISQSLTDSITFFNEKKNDGFIFRDGLNYTVVDISSGSSSFLYKLMQEAGNDRAVEIETLALTHYHSGHTGSVNSALSRWKVRRVLLPVPENESDMSISDALVQACRREGTEIVFYTRKDGSTINSGSIKIKFYDYTMLSRSTHPVICFSAEAEGKSVTYLGSSFFEASSSAMSDAEKSETVFLGAHPPKSKSGTDITLTGNTVFTEEAYKFLSEISVIQGGERIILPSGGGVYKKES